MPLVEVFEKDADTPLFVGNFDFLPRIGDKVSKDMGGYFGYYIVVDMWHREEAHAPSTFQACIEIALKD